MKYLDYQCPNPVTKMVTWGKDEAKLEVVPTCDRHLWAFLDKRSWILVESVTQDACLVAFFGPEGAWESGKW